jgi:hypothetical protein
MNGLDGLSSLYLENNVMNSFDVNTFDYLITPLTINLFNNKNLSVNNIAYLTARYPDVTFDVDFEGNFVSFDHL